jgi:hypothetical protein
MIQTRFETLLLRAGKVFMVLVLTGLAAEVARAVPQSKDDKPPIPADLFYEFKPVPANENAIINWRLAAQVETPLSEQARRSIKFCWTPAAREPSADELDSLRAWLKRNQEALDSFNASLQKSGTQWPERNPQNPQPELKALPLMIGARLFQADQLAEQGKFATAARSLEESLKLAQRGVEGDAALIHYLVACNARTLTQDAILRLACRKDMPVFLLEDLLQKLPRLDSETNVYDHILRVEFTRDYDESLDLKKLTTDWANVAATNAAVIAALYPPELQRAFRVLLDPSLVAVHPKPFDAVAEIEKNIQHYRIYRTNSLAPWSERDGQVELDHEEAYTNLVEDLGPLMALVKDDSLPLSRLAAQKARPAYLKIENPVGRIFDTSIIGFVSSDLKVCQVRTEREATRACLALIIFERRKGSLPASLAELVQEKILDAVPRDPFCGEPLHYSRENRKIWSISDDGVDDHGESGKTRWYEKDAVWQIPELR